MTNHLLYNTTTRNITYTTPTGQITINNSNINNINNINISNTSNTSNIFNISSTSNTSNNSNKEDIIENINFTHILGILSIENIDHLVIVKTNELVGLWKGTNLYKISNIDFLPLNENKNLNEDFCFYLRHLIINNGFYVCKDVVCEEEYVWNMHMIREFIRCCEGGECDMDKGNGCSDDRSDCSGDMNGNGESGECDRSGEINEDSNECNVDINSIDSNSVDNDNININSVYNIKSTKIHKNNKSHRSTIKNSNSYKSTTKYHNKSKSHLNYHNIQSNPKSYKSKLNSNYNTIKITHIPNIKSKNYLLAYLTCGHFITKNFILSTSFYTITLLSLVSSNKMGTRLLSRGIDINGNVSFFVKTHLIIKKNNMKIFDFLILRGTIPLFWKQKNKGLNGKVYFTNTIKNMEIAFDKHFNKLRKQFNKIHVITLLGNKSDEKMLNDAYCEMMRNKNVTFSKFDLNSFVDDFANLKINLYWHLDKIESDVMMECGREERMECGRERDVMMECDKGMLDCGDGCDGRDERYTDYRCEGRMDYVCDGEEKMDYRCTTEEGRMDCNIDCNNKGRLNYFYKSKRYSNKFKDKIHNNKDNNYINKEKILINSNKEKILINNNNKDNNYINNNNIHINNIHNNNNDIYINNNKDNNYVNNIKHNNKHTHNKDNNKHTHNKDNNKHTHNKNNNNNIHNNKNQIIYRVNCIDCLDRTNLAQFLICKYRLNKQMGNTSIDKILQECWTENGNALSNLYTGSDVMKKELSLKQKRSLKGMFDDFVISATRLINNRFTDKQKNKMINMLLGREECEDE